jgi:hypothetical protein
MKNRKIKVILLLIFLFLKINFINAIEKAALIAQSIDGVTRTAAEITDSVLEFKTNNKKLELLKKEREQKYIRYLKEQGIDTSSIDESKLKSIYYKTKIEEEQYLTELEKQRKKREEAEKKLNDYKEKQQIIKEQKIKKNKKKKEIERQKQEKKELAQIKKIKKSKSKLPEKNQFKEENQDNNDSESNSESNDFNRRLIQKKRIRKIPINKTKQLQKNNFKSNNNLEEYNED